MPLESVRPVRSFLFVPGNRPEWMRKALDSGADGIIVDIEDAIPPLELERSRAVVKEFIDSVPQSGPVVMVRVGPARSQEVAEDIAAVMSPRLDGIVLPMVFDVGDVRRAETALEKAEALVGATPSRCVLVPLLETANALRTCYDLAMVSSRTAYMGSGISRAGDIARAIGYSWTPEGLETLAFRSMALLHLRAAGVQNLVSGMWGAVRDLDGLRMLAQQTRQIGYEGMMVIHPSHVPIVNEIFTPTKADVSAWQAMIDGLAESYMKGRGATVVGGQLVDAAQLKTAEQGLARARAFGVVG